MKKVEYRFGSFVDYTGTERKFVMAAVSIPADETYEGMKACALGVSVCRPNDEYNEELGKTIAYGKALKEQVHVLYSPSNGVINTKVVNAFIDQEVEFFKQNPGSYLASYNDDREKYLDKQAAEKYLEDEELRSAVVHFIAASQSVKDFKDFLRAAAYLETSSNA